MLKVHQMKKLSRKSRSVDCKIEPYVVVRFYHSHILFME